MAIVIKMPRLSDTMEEGGIANWLKQEGEVVEEGETLVEIETDKATMEYQSPESGHLLRILVAAGESVDLGTPIAVLGDEGEQIDEALLKNTSQTSAAPEPAPPQKQEQVPAPMQKQEQVLAPTTSARIKASPLARRLAAEKGVHLANVRGSGPQGAYRRTRYCSRQYICCGNTKSTYTHCLVTDAQDDCQAITASQARDTSLLSQIFR